METLIPLILCARRIFRRWISVLSFFFSSILNFLGRDHVTMSPETKSPLCVNSHVAATCVPSNNSRKTFIFVLLSFPTPIFVFLNTVSLMPIDS